MRAWCTRLTRLILRRAKRARSPSSVGSPISAGSPIPADIAQENQSLKRAALHVVAPGVLEKNPELLKPGKALLKEGLPHDNNATVKLKRVTRHLKIQLRTWAEDPRDGRASPVSPPSVSPTSMSARAPGALAEPQFVLKFSSPTAAADEPKPCAPPIISPPSSGRRVTPTRALWGGCAVFFASH